MRETKCEELLQCILTNEEKIEYAKAMSEHISKKARAEDNLKSVSASIKSEITSLQSQINVIADNINNGYVYRSIRCRIEWDFEEKVKRYIRLDTGEGYKAKPISDLELQEELDLQEKKKAAEIEEDDLDRDIAKLESEEQA